MLFDERRLNESMDADRLDVLIATTTDNVFYTTGYWAPPPSLRRQQAYAVIPRHGPFRSCAVTNSAVVDLDADKPISLSPGIYDSIRLIQEHTGPVAALVAIIKKLGLSRGRIGFDELGMTPQCIDRLVSTLPDACFIRSHSTLAKVRAIKTENEIERLRRAAVIAERAITTSLDNLVEGMSEIDVARELHRAIVDVDGLPIVSCIGFGERSALENVQPSTRRLNGGDVIRIDVSCRFQHYRSSIARTTVFGSPSLRVLEYHNALLQGLTRAREIIQPGLRAADLFTEVINTIRKAGIASYQADYIGYGLGLDTFDAPRIFSSNDEVIRENMVLCVDAAYYERGFAGLQAKDTILVTKGGNQSMLFEDKTLFPTVTAKLQ